jgi:hypothetical protein
LACLGRGNVAVSSKERIVQTSEKTDQIFPAIISAQSKIRAVGKKGRNDHHKYNYARLEDYIAAINPVLAKYDLGIISSGDSRERSSNLSSVTIAIRVIHTSGQWIEVKAFGEGSDNQDKAIYKATTGARKYGLATLFNMITTDDPESYADTGPDVEKLTQSFSTIGVTVSQLERYVGTNIHQITPGKYENLRLVYYQIKQGEKKVEQVFGEDPTSPEAVSMAKGQSDVQRGGSSNALKPKNQAA